jgi:hypothetical protein
LPKARVVKGGDADRAAIREGIGIGHLGVLS